MIKLVYLRARAVAALCAAFALTLLSVGATATLVADVRDADGDFAFVISGAQTVTTEGYAAQYQHIGLTGLITAGPLSILGELHLQNDRKYSEGHGGGYWLGVNGTLEQGGAMLDLSAVTLRVGRFYHADDVASPYSLFVSSMPIGAPMLELDVRTPSVFFTTRSIELNRDSARGYPDRGVAIRSYGITTGPWRVGFQDAIVFVDRTFDLEYFINPIPGFLLQYLKRSAGTPWAISVNHNSLLGFFVDYDRPGVYGYAQILIDDINFNRFVKPDDYQNPDKIAWSIGGRVDLPSGAGRIGLFHAGATMYTFQAYGGGGVGSASDTRYGYVYYPDVEYTVDGEVRAIHPEDNYIGYLHGENNLAFIATYDHELAVRPFPNPVAVDASLEYVLSGSKSPGNPWHQYNWYAEAGEGTRFLEDERLESKVTGRVNAATRFGDWRFNAGLALGFVVNELELTAVDPDLIGPNNQIRYFAPGTVRRPIAELRLGASYALRYRVADRDPAGRTRADR